MPSRREEMKECCVFSVNAWNPLVGTLRADGQAARAAKAAGAGRRAAVAPPPQKKQMVAGQKKSSVLLGPKTRPKSVLDFVNGVLFVGL